jgi:hypothetical protein
MPLRRLNEVADNRSGHGHHGGCASEPDQEPAPIESRGLVTSAALSRR